jgi:hypothetical protein
MSSNPSPTKKMVDDEKLLILSKESNGLFLLDPFHNLYTYFIIFDQLEDYYFRIIFYYSIFAYLYSYRTKVMNVHLENLIAMEKNKE